jgi:2-polyprenyl-3-methyl-5-hydroxy-6-metoxy-1,4-benzoquinol methylase
MTQQLLGHFTHIDVLEPATTLSKVLQDKFGTRITLYTESTETFSPVQNYDAIFLVHVLEHIDDPVATLIKISSWLKADGCLFIMVPNGMAISRQLARLMGIMENELDVLPGERAQGHVRTYDRETLLRHARDSSLSIVRSGGVLFKPLANFQLDRCLEAGIIDESYVQALDQLARRYPDQSSSIFVVAKQ